MAAMQETNQHRAVVLKHLSPSFVEQLDAKYGVVKAENGGYCEFHIKCEGQARPRWWEVLARYLTFQHNA